MNKTAKMIIVLTVITALSGAVLSTWDSITKPKIAYHQLQALKAAISNVLPLYDYYEEKAIDDKTVYIGKIDDDAQNVGVAFTGSRYIENAISMNKRQTKEILSRHGIQTPECIVIPPEEIPGLAAARAYRGFSMPCIVKPLSSGSSLGGFLG